MKTTQIPVEVQFAQKLAANDPKLRDRAVKKLKRWLSNSKISLSEEEMLKIWKGLYYCFWMSDKPLVQEELAERISSFIHCFQDPSQSTAFVRAFIATLGREWFGIDRWRTDKFMMFVRRVLRQIFFYMFKQSNSEIARNVLSAIETLFVPATKRIALGFQLHVVDVYLEELAKVVGENGSNIGNEFLTPFIREIANGDDDRLANNIEERIFKHLMRQSDIGIAYEEGQNGQWSDDDDDDNDDQEEEKETEDNDHEEMEVEDNKEGVMDPRAGKVDVILPQLKVDFAQISQLLFEAGSSKKVSQQRRKILYKLSKQFKCIAEETSYPLAIDVDLDEEYFEKTRKEKKSIRVSKVAKSKLKEDLKHYDENRKSKKELKELLKEKRKKQNGNIELTKEDTSSEQEFDEREEKEEVEEVEEGTRKRKRNYDDSENDDGNIQNVEVKKRKKDEGVILKKKKKKNAKSKVNGIDQQNGVPDVLEQTEPSTSIVKEKKKKKKLIESQNAEGTSKNKETEILPQKGIGGFSPPTIKSQTSPPKTPIFLKKAKSKSMSAESNKVKSTLLGKKKNERKLSLDTPKIKRVNFVMTQNKHQSIKEHAKSIIESPEIPFLPEKKPKQGVLKVKGDTPTNVTSLSTNQKVVQRNTIINGKSKAIQLFKWQRASDFF